MPNLTKAFAKKNDVLRKFWMRQARIYALRPGEGDYSNWYPVVVGGNETGRILRNWWVDDPSPSNDLTVFLPIMGIYTVAFAEAIGGFGFTQNFREDPSIVLYAKTGYDASTRDGKRVWSFSCKRYRKPITIQIPFGTPFVTSTGTPGDQ